jgi:hypothetical protein
MYIPTSNEKKIEITTKTTSSVEYHTSIIQSIEIVKRPLLFNEHDNDTSSRFFSSSTIKKSSIFDAINENQNTTLNKEEISPNNNNSNKRFKRSNTDKEEEDSPLQVTIQSSMDTFLTPAKQNRIVLKRKSPNVEKESSPVDQSDIKTLEHEVWRILFLQNEFSFNLLILE